MADTFITSLQASKLLGYTVQHTRLLIRKGKIHAVKLGRDWLIGKKSLKALMASTAVK